jgi:hypothetical protein
VNNPPEHCGGQNKSIAEMTNSNNSMQPGWGYVNGPSGTSAMRTMRSTAHMAVAAL